MTRTADATILTRAGIEKGVASTKHFQLKQLFLDVILYFAKAKNVISNELLWKRITYFKRSSKITLY